VRKLAYSAEARHLATDKNEHEALGSKAGMRIFSSNCESRKAQQLCCLFFESKPYGLFYK
jgi:hypothetical protein